MSKEAKPKEEKNVTFQEYYTNMRNQVTISCENSKEFAIKALDDLAQKFAQSQQQNEALQTALKDKVETTQKSDKKEKKE